MGGSKGEESEELLSPLTENVESILPSNVHSPRDTREDIEAYSSFRVPQHNPTTLRQQNLQKLCKIFILLDLSLILSLVTFSLFSQTSQKTDLDTQQTRQSVLISDIIREKHNLEFENKQNLNTIQTLNTTINALQLNITSLNTKLLFYTNSNSNYTFPLQFLVTAPNYGKVGLWLINSDGVVNKAHTGLGISGGIKYAMNINMSNGEVVVGGEDSSVRIWNIITQESKSIFEEQGNSVRSVVFKERYVISGSEDGSIAFYDYEQQELVKKISTSEKVFSILILSDGRTVSGHSSFLRIWDLDMILYIQITLPTGSNRVYDMKQISTTKILILLQNQAVSVDVSAAVPDIYILQLYGQFRCILLLSDGDFALGGSSTQGKGLVNVGTILGGKYISTITHQFDVLGTVRAMALIDFNYIVIGGTFMDLLFWHIHTLQVVSVPNGYSSGLYALGVYTLHSNCPDTYNS